jgi:ubiquinol-cytochrome c reductase cytochrome c subunit
VRWLRRRLTRPSRVPRWLRASVALVMGALAIAGLAAPTGGAATTTTTITPATATTPTTTAPLPPSQNGPTKPPFAPGPGASVVTFPSSPAILAEGQNLFRQSCSSCHGLDLRGIPNRGPALRGVGAGPVDFFLSTGGMPLRNPTIQPEIPQKPAFKRQQIDAIVAYVASYGGPPSPTADPSKGDLGTGYHQFTLNCAGCHQVVARGGMLVGAWIPNLLHVNARQIAQAVRMGPYLMPRFDYHQLDQHDLDSIARYVLYSQHPANLGGWGIYNIGPIPEGIVAWLLGLAALVIVARLIGERNDEEVVTPPMVPPRRPAAPPAPPPTPAPSPPTPTDRAGSDGS